MNLVETLDRIAYRYREAAEATGTSLNTIRAAVERGELTARQISERVIVIERQELEAWIHNKPAV